MFEDKGFWGKEQNKSKALHEIYLKRVKNLIFLQRKDKLYMMLEQISTSLVLVYQHNYDDSKNSCLLLLDDLIFTVKEIVI